MTAYDANALRTFIDSALVGLNQRCLRSEEDREIVSKLLVEVLTEYFDRPRPVILVRPRQ